MGALIVKYVERHPTASNKIRVTWSEPANASDAGTAGNYAMSGGVSVSAASVLAGNLQVDLTVSALAKSTAYTLTVSNVRDIAGGVAISSPRNQEVFTWLGIGDDNLDGVPVNGGFLVRAMRTLIGDFVLGYNALGVLLKADPDIDNVTPVGASIGTQQPWTARLSLAPAFGIISRIIINVEYPSGVSEEAFIDGAFTPAYNGKSTIAQTSPGVFQISMLRNGGWPASPNIRLHANSDRGGMTE